MEARFLDGVNAGKDRLRICLCVDPSMVISLLKPEDELHRFAKEGTHWTGMLLRAGQMCGE